MALYKESKKKEKTLTFLLFCLIVSGLFMFSMTYKSFMGDKKIIDSFDKDMLRISLFNRYENKFNYLHGLWLIPSGVFFMLLLVLLELPSFGEVFIKIKKDFKEKIKREF